MNIATFEETELTGNSAFPGGRRRCILELTRNEEFSVEDMGRKAIMTDSV
ncbi:MAG: hypothetical protein R3F17_02410 [Planctomycetota bacterium]